MEPVPADSCSGCLLRQCVCVAGEAPLVAEVSAAEVANETSELIALDSVHQERRSAVRDISEILPAWAYRKEVAENSLAMDDLSCAVGPCIPLLRLTALATFLARAGIFTTALVTTTCANGGNTMYQLWFWLTVLPVAVLRLCVEWRVLQHVLAPFAAKAGFVVYGCTVPFVVWLVFFFVDSQNNLGDSVSDGIFSGETLQKDECRVGKDMLRLFADAWKISPVGKLGVPSPGVNALVWVCWLLTLPGSLWPLIRTLRWDDIASGAFLRGSEIGNAGGGRNIWGDWLNNDDIMFDLADAAGMIALQELAYASANAEFDTNLGRIGWDVGMIFDKAAALGYGMTNRMVFAGLLENCVQVNLQTSFFVLHMVATRLLGDHDRHAPWTSAEVQAMLSLAFSWSMSMLKLREAWEFASFVARVFQELEKMISERAPSKEEGYRERFLRKPMVRKLRRFLWVVRLSSACLLISLVYCGCKLVASRFCHDMLWSLGGCADLRT